jgi:hypothetical protein
MQSSRWQKLTALDGDVFEKRVADATVTDRHGRRRVYGTPNAGFERYPGQGERPVYRRRED